MPCQLIIMAISDENENYYWRNERNIGVGVRQWQDKIWTLKRDGTPAIALVAIIHLVKISESLKITWVKCALGLNVKNPRL